jgi:hypothetical protein
MQATESPEELPTHDQLERADGRSGRPEAVGHEEERHVELSGRFEGALRAWEQHMELCTECFDGTERLCGEGLLLSVDVVSARAGLEAFEMHRLGPVPAPRATAPVGSSADRLAEGRVIG